MKHDDSQNGKSETPTMPSRTVSDSGSARRRMSANVNSSDSLATSSSRLPMMSMKLSPSLASSVRLSLASTSTNTLLTHSSPSWMMTFELGTNCKFGTTLLSGAPSSIASSGSSLAILPPNGDMTLTSSSDLLIISNKERRGKGKCQWLILSLIAN